jgi:hypothetical protein
MSMLRYRVFGFYNDEGEGREKELDLNLEGCGVF